VDTIAKNILKIELWRRAAWNFEKTDLHPESAAAWLAAGDDDKAVNALIKAGDRAQATPLLIKAKRYKEALEQAHLWLEEISQEPQRQADEMVPAFLFLAAALTLDQQPEPAFTAYDRARRKLSQSAKTSLPLTTGRNWETLATYGILVKRPDLIRLGYEKALTTYGQTFNLQRLRCAGEYLETVKNDHCLSRDLQGRIASWQPRSSIKRERERLWQAMSEFTNKS